MLLVANFGLGFPSLARLSLTQIDTLIHLARASIFFVEPHAR